MATELADSERLSQILAERRSGSPSEPADAAPRPPVGSESGAPASAPTLLRRVDRTSALPLSFAQERLWFLAQLEPGNPAYNLCQAVRLEGTLSVAALARSLTEIVRRHEVLRTAIVTTENGPRQVIRPPAPLDLPAIDLRRLGERAPAEARRLVAREVRRPFDLSCPPLLRACWIELAGEEHQLLLTVHHVASDGWSLGVAVRELARLYPAYAAGERSPMADLPVQYADFAAWQRERLEGGPATASEGSRTRSELERQVEFWRRHLGADTPVLELPADRSRAAPEARRSRRAGRRRIVLRPDVRSRLAALGQEEGATLFMVLLAAFKILLARLSGQSSVTIGTPVAGRGHEELEGLIGFFVNTLALRSDLEGATPFRRFLRQVRRTTLAAYEHQEVPFEKLVAELQPARDLSRTPLFQAMLVLQNAPFERLRLPDLVLSPVPVDPGSARFDLYLSLIDRAAGLGGWLEYDRELFDASTAGRWVESFKTLLAGLVEDPEACLGDLPLLAPGARHQLLEEWNDTGAAARRGTVHELFRERASRQPDAVAVAFGDEQLSYGELVRRAGGVAGELRRSGVGPEVRVAVLVRRSVEMVAALLGVLEAGGTYVPLDPAYPRRRLTFMIEDSGAAVLLVDRTTAGTVPPGGFAELRASACRPAQDPLRASRPVAGPSHAAYLIYTSGSTGRPKGVSVPHGGLVNFLAAMESRPGSTAGDVWLALASLSFDISGLELYLPLLAGGRVEIVSAAQAADGEALRELLESRRATVLQATPATWRLLLAASWEGGGELVALSGGEALPDALARRVAGRGKALWNLYGPTEATIWAAVERVGAGRFQASGPVSIGRPITNLQARVLDARLRSVPIGVPGELYLGGAGLARGYQGRPALTAASWLPDAFPGIAGARLYRTGDRVRRLTDGRLVFLERIDHQVKLRGYRIELGEIEEALGRVPRVRSAAVLLQAGSRREPRLVACVASEPRVTAAELERSLRQRLPAYMVPARFAFFETLPLTPNRKVDRRALARAVDEGGALSAVQAEREAPRTPLEETLAAIWSQVLDVAEIGRQDDFFALGGHSLLATRVIARVAEAIGREVPLRTLFEAPTLADWARKVADLRRGERAAPPVLEPAPSSGDPPLSFAQERLWLLDQIEPASAAYNLPAALALHGELDRPALAVALAGLVRRHDVLRTVFENRGGRPAAKIVPAGFPELPLVDLSALRSGDRRRQGELGPAAVGRRPFDLATGPLLRAGLFALGRDENVLALCVHHVAADAWSVGIALGEIAELYRAAVARRPPVLRVLPLRYADYAAWQRGWLEGPTLAAELDFWRRRLAAMPPALELPADRRRRPVRAQRGGRILDLVPRGLSEELRELGQRHGATLFMVLLAGFKTLLHRATGRTDLAVGSPVANRERRALEGLVGLFVNTLVLRTDLAGDPSFRRLLERVREVSLSAYEHQDLPFEKLVEELALPRDLAHTPLFQVMLTLHNAPAPPLELPGLEIEPREIATRAARFDLTLTLAESRRGLHASWEYDRDLFDAATVRRMAGHLRSLLASAVNAPQLPLSGLPLLSRGERHQLLREWAAGEAAVEPGASTVHHWLDQGARRTPDAIAVASGELQWSFRELVALSDRLAGRLEELGVGPGARVGLCGERSFELVVGLLAILKAGGAYVPLDPAYPRQRLSFLLAEACSGEPLLVTQRALLSGLPPHRGRVLCLDAERPVATRRERGLRPSCRDAAPAYVIYTSGSTGKPKGVEISHRSLARFLSAMAACCGPGAGETLLSVTTFAFDIFGLELFLPLLAGARVVLADRQVAADPVLLARELDRQRASVMQATPVAWRLLVESGWPGAPGLRILCGGEAMPAALAGELAGRGRELWNLYGPTEATIWATLHRVRPVEGAERRRLRQPVSIGRPLPGMRVAVVDPRGSPAPAGVPGELLLGGEQLARGYLDRAGTTARSFVPDPFGETPGERLYRTGDLARWTPDGRLAFLGRLDHQVKIRGFRIELEEIETVLGRHPEVEQAVALVRGDDELVVCVVPASPARPSVEDLREVARRELPAYMVPSAFVFLDSLPLTSNRKVDRAALGREVLAVETPRPATPFLPPRTETQRAVAEILQQVLGVDRVGLDDNFFDLGGNSARLVELTSKLRDRFQRELLVVDLFTYSSIRALAGHLGEPGPPASDPAAPETRREQLSVGRRRLQRRLEQRRRAESGMGRAK